MRNLLDTQEIWSDEGGEFKLEGYVIAWEEDGKQYPLEHQGTTFDLERLEAPSPIPSEYLSVPWLSGYREAPRPLPPTTFVKAIPAIRYTPHDPTLPSELMRKEIEVYMTLLHAPHPNICPFYGCTRDGQRAIALVLKKVPHELPDRWRYVTPDIVVPKLVILRGVRRGLAHLHGLGIVHNDINKGNILLDEAFKPVIIDFNTALPEGESRVEWVGTPGWFRPSSLSFGENDIFALGLFAKWLDGWEEDPSSFLKPDEPCSWTEDYLSPKILASGAPSSLYRDMLSRAFYSGAHVTLFDENRDNPLDIPTHLLNERMNIVAADSYEGYAHAWAKACAGLRSGELDVILFPIRKDLLNARSEELERLRSILATTPSSLRHPRMQPRLILFDVDSDFNTSNEVSRLEAALRALAQESWKSTISDLNKPTVVRDADHNDDEMEPPIQTWNTEDIFHNFVLVQPGGWFSWRRLRVCLWQSTASGASDSSFETDSHLVAPEDLVDFVLEPPQRRPSNTWLARAANGVMGVDDPLLFTYVFAQAALTIYVTYRLAWAI